MYQVVFYTSDGIAKPQFEHLLDAVKYAAHQAGRQDKSQKVWLELKAGAFAHQDLILVEFSRGKFSDDLPIKCNGRPELLAKFITEHVARYLDWSEDISLPIEERLQCAQSAARLPSRMEGIMKDLSAHLSATIEGM